MISLTTWLLAMICFKFLSGFGFFFFFFFLFRATLVAYGNSQAPGQIRAAAACLHHSPVTWDPSSICGLQHSSRQCRILNPLSEAKDWTQILLDTSRVHFRWATAGTPWISGSIFLKHILAFIYLFIFIFLLFLGLLPRHMEVLRLGVESEL